MHTRQLKQYTQDN